MTESDTVHRTARGAALALVLAPALASAAIIGDQSTSPLSPSFYLVQAYGEIKDSADQTLTDSGIATWSASPMAPASESATLSAGGSSSSFSTFASLDGFLAARTSATMTVTNAVGNYGYSAVASQGSRSQVRFSSAQTPGRLDFGFAITGTETEPFGDSLGRLDFLVRPLATSTSYFDVFNGTPFLGAGNFTYSYVGSTADPLDVLFYVSAATLVGFPQFGPQFGYATPGATFTSTANYGNTFNLTSIDAYTAAGARITDWTLTDLASNQMVFNQDGRVATSVPEPATLALLGLGLAGLGVARRRRAVPDRHGRLPEPGAHGAAPPRNEISGRTTVWLMR